MTSRIAPRDPAPIERATERANAATNDASLKTLTRVIQASVARQEAKAASSLPAGLHYTAPAIVTLKPGHPSLRGLMPIDAAERGVVNAFIKAFPFHMAVNPGGVLGSIREGLETDGDLQLVDMQVVKGRKGVPELHVQRIHASMLAAMEGEAAALVCEAIGRAASNLPREMTAETLSGTAGPMDTTATRLLQHLHASGATTASAFARDVGLSNDEVATLAKGGAIRTPQSPAAIAANLYRFALAMKAPSWQSALGMSAEQLTALKDKVAREHGVATPRESARFVRYPVPPIFANAVSHLSDDDQARVMGAIVARVRGDHDGDDARFASSVGITRQQAEQMLDGSLRVSPKPVVEVIESLLSVYKRIDGDGWWKHTNLDEADLKDLRALVSHHRTIAPLAGNTPPRTTQSLDAAALLAVVAPSDRSVVSECMSAMCTNKLCSDASAFRGVVKVARDDFAAMLKGGSIDSPLSARALVTRILDFVADADVKEDMWRSVMTHSRSDVARALDRLRG